MKKPTVDYRTFRLSRINEPQFSHLKLLLGWVWYLAMFFLTEKFIPVEKCYVVHCSLDELIPFCEIFLIPYVLWYFFIVFTLGYFLLYNVEGFKKLQTYIIITQIIAMAIYIFFPNCQNLRPEVFPRDNFLTDLTGIIYSIDTNTGVCPSMHCAYSVAMASAWLREKDISSVSKTVVLILTVLICLSTMFIKQHSAVDFFAALLVCLVAEIIVYGKKNTNGKRAR